MMPLAAVPVEQLRLTGWAAGHLLASGDDDFGAGFIAFVVVVALGLACYFLFTSMSRHLRKVPSTFDPPEPEQDEQDERP